MRSPPANYGLRCTVKAARRFAPQTRNAGIPRRPARVRYRLDMDLTSYGSYAILSV